MQLVWLLTVISPTGSLVRVFDCEQSVLDFIWYGEAQKQYPNCIHVMSKHEVEVYEGKI